MESKWYILIEICLCIIISFILVYYYSRRGTNPLAMITAGVTWSLNFILIVFIPFDIYYTYSDTKKDNSVNDILTIGYKFIYWSLFLCSWIFVPLMQEYEDSGDFTKKRKFFRSIRNNIIFYTILGIIFIVFIVVAFIYYKGVVDSLKTFVFSLMNCSYLIGLLLFYFLFGYSIISLPKKTFYKTNYEKQIQYLEWRAIDLKNNLDKIQGELVDDGYLLQSTLEHFQIMKRVRKSKTFEDDEEKKDGEQSEKEIRKSRNNSLSSPILQDYADIINERYDYLYDNAKVFGINLKRNTVDNDKDPLESVEDLIKLNRKINKNEWDNLRIQIRIRNQYTHWLVLSTVLSYEKNQGNHIEITSTINDEKLLPNNENIEQNVQQEQVPDDENYIVDDAFIPYKDMSSFKLFYYRKLRRVVLFIYTSIIVLCGLLTLISQVGAIPIFKFSLYGKIVKAVIEKDLGILGLHFFIMIPIIFLFVMSIYTFFKLKISGYFYMYKNKQTDSVSLMYFSTNLCRISFSICLDFIFNIRVEFDKDNDDYYYYQNITNITNNTNYTNFTDFIGNITKKFPKNETQIQTILEFNDKDETSLFFKIYNYSSLILFVYVLILLFKLPQRIAKLCGKRIFEAESDESMNEIKEGHDYFMEINKEYEGGIIPKEVLILPEDKYNRA